MYMSYPYSNALTTCITFGNLIKADAITQPTEFPTYMVLSNHLIDGGRDDGQLHNLMTKQADGTYEITFNNVWRKNFVSVHIWAFTGVDEQGNNISNSASDTKYINILQTCDVTVNFDPATKKISVYGTPEYVSSVTYEDINRFHIMGNGDGGWLNDISYDEMYDGENSMTEISPNVYSIEFREVEQNDELGFVFVSDEASNFMLGGTFVDYLTEASAKFVNGYQPIVINNPYEFADITITLDMTNFDFETMQGASFTVEIVDRTPVFIGDANRDGKIDVNDVTVVQKHIAQIVDLSVDEHKQIAADTDYNGEINITDVTYIQQYLCKNYGSSAGCGNRKSFYR